MIWPARSSTMPLVAWLSLINCRNTCVIDVDVSSSMMSWVRCGSNCPSIEPAGVPTPGPLGGLAMTVPASRQTTHPASIVADLDHRADGARRRKLCKDGSAIVGRDGQYEAESHVQCAIALVRRQVALRHQVGKDRIDRPGGGIKFGGKPGGKHPGD